MFTLFRCFTGTCETYGGDPIPEKMFDEFEYGFPLFIGYFLIMMLVSVGLFNLIMAAGSLPGFCWASMMSLSPQRLLEPSVALGGVLKGLHRQCHKVAEPAQAEGRRRLPSQTIIIAPGTPNREALREGRCHEPFLRFAKDFTRGRIKPFFRERVK